jgi:hypothetical protein
VTVQEVIRVMKQNNAKAFSLLKALVDSGPKLWNGSTCPDEGLRHGLFMPEEAIPLTKKSWLNVLRA